MCFRLLAFVSAYDIQLSGNFGEHGPLNVVAAGSLYGMLDIWCIRWLMEVFREFASSEQRCELRVRNVQGSINVEQCGCQSRIIARTKLAVDQFAQSGVETPSVRLNRIENSYHTLLNS